MNIRTPTFLATILLSITLMGVTTASAENTSYYLRADTISYSEPTSIASLLNEFNRGFEPGELAFSYSQLEVGLVKNQWEIGLFTRLDYLLEFSRDTAELVYLDENDLPLDEEREYQLFIRANHFKARGLTLGYQFKENYGIRSRLAVSYLYADSVILGSLAGSARTNGDNSYLGRVDVDYAYTEDVLIDRPVSDVHGHGLTVDVDLHWQVSEELYLSGEIRDLYGEIDWGDAPHSALRIEPVAPTIGDDGLIKTQPTLTGRETEKKTRQRIPTKTTLEIGYALEEYTPFIRAFHTNVKVLPSIGLRYGTQEHNHIDYSYNWRNNVLSVGYRKPGYKITLASDDIRFSRAKVFSLTVDYFYDRNY